ncbi:MAG: GntR family transcriptional regulator [Pseudomonadota bacterium]
MNNVRIKVGKLDPTAPISRQVHSWLRDAIIRNEFAPGDRISESEIAKAFDVSRQPVRETFIKLSGEGLLMILPQRGTVISKIEYTTVLDARFLREAIEADIVRIVVSNPDARLIKELRKQLVAQHAVASDAPLEFRELDEEFHRTLASAAGKAGAWRQIEGLKSQMDRVRHLTLSAFPVDTLIDQHTTIVNRIEAGDREGADSAIRLHLREVLKTLPEVYAAHPDVFEIPDGGLPDPVNTPI